MNRICTGCNRDLPVTSEYFHKKNTKSGFASRCKVCISNYHKKYFEGNEKVHERKRIQGKKYYNSKSTEINSRRRKQYEEGTSAKKNYMDTYYKVNQESILIKRKNYLSTEEGWAKKVSCDQLRRSREKRLQSSFSASDWKSCKEHFDNNCAYCGEKKPLTREHLIPLVNGGEYTINNIIPACKSCNSKKRDNDFFTWYPKQEFYSKQREQKILKYLNYKDHTQQLALL